MRRMRRAAFTIVLSALVFAPCAASASGLFLSDRGVRPLSRGGAFVAGADDLGAIVYNPAGIYDAEAQVFVDASVVLFDASFTRQALVHQQDPNTGADVATFKQTFPTVQGTSAPLPIPTIAVSMRLAPRWVGAIGTWAPYSPLISYPESISVKGVSQPAPQRYSLISLAGSALTIVGAWAAYEPSPRLRIGAGVEALVGSVQSSLTVGGCAPDRFLCATEQKEWDALTQLRVGPIVAPSGNVGVTWIPSPKWRVGGSFQLPFWVRSSATLATRMPSTPAFSKASQVGDAVDVGFDLPWQLRAGVEGRLWPHTRVEASVGYDGWSIHDAIRAEPRGIALENVAGFPARYPIPAVSLARNFRDSVSVHAGGEHHFEAWSRSFVARAGLSVASSAVPANFVSVLSLDAPNATLALGLGAHFGKMRLDLGLAHTFFAPIDVDPATGRVVQQTPVLATPPKHPDIINGGHYEASANVVGLGLAYSLERSPVAP